MARKKKSIEDTDSEYTSSESAAKICNGKSSKDCPDDELIDGDHKEDEEMEIAYSNGFQNGCSGTDDMGRIPLFNTIIF